MDNNSVGDADATGGADDSHRTLEHEVDVLLAKAGASVPADRKAGIVAGYADIKRMSALLRQPMTAADEPSNIFSLAGHARSPRQ